MIVIIVPIYFLMGGKNTSVPKTHLLLGVATFDGGGFLDFIGNSAINAEVQANRSSQNQEHAKR